jgi:CBS domain-containing protein
VEKRPLHAIAKDASLEEAMQLLAQKNVLSLPVYEETQLERQYVGIIDCFDVLCYAPLWQTHPPSFGSATVSDLLASSRRGRRLCAFDPKESLYTAMKELGTDNHRGLVRTKGVGRNDYQIVSQSDVVRFLVKNMEQLGDVVNTRIQNLNLANPLGDSNLVCASSKEPSLLVFQRMYSNGVKAVPIMNDKGELVGNLSATDLRGLSSKTLSMVKLPVLEFLQAAHKEKPPHPVSCPPSATLGDVMLRATTANVHRLWVTDSALKPIGVVTLTDVINTLLQLSESQ